MIDILFIIILLCLFAFVCVNVYYLGRIETEIHILVQMHKILQEMEITEEKIEYNKGIYHCLTELEKHKKLEDTINEYKNKCRQLINRTIKKCQNIKNQLTGKKNS